MIVRQSTAGSITVGPVLDADGVAVTDGVIGDFKISKNGAAPAALNGSATLTHRHTGHYSLTWTTSDVDTVGTVDIVIDDTVNACAPVRLQVIEEAIYDAFYAASATPDHFKATSVTVSDKTGFSLASSQTFDLTGNITGNLSGSVGSVSGNVGGNVSGSVGSISGVTFPTNFGDLAISATNGYVDLGFINGVDAVTQLGSTCATASSVALNAFSWIGITVGAVSDKAGFSLAADQSGVTIGTVNAMAGTITTLDALDAAQDSQHSTTQSAITTAQNDLNILTGDDGAILATVQGNYAPAQAGDQMDLVDAPNATAVTAIQNGLALATKLLNYVRLLARKDSAVATDLATELAEINADTGTGTGAYSNNDAQESIRDNASGLDAAGVRAAVGLAAANLDTQLGAIAGDTGSGANSITPTVTDGTDPLESAKVRFTKGAESYLQSTNASGTFSTPFALDNGTWTVTITLPGYTFSTTTLVVTGNATPTYAMTATGLSVPESPRIRARLLVLDATTKLGLPDISLTVTVAGAAAAAGYGSRVTSRTITSDANGLAEWYALPGEDYTVTGPSGTEYTIRIPSTATDPHNLTSILI